MSFGIRIFDALYKHCYYFALHRANFVTYVSKNMYEIVQAHTRDISRTLLLPNSPEFIKIPRIDPKEKDCHQLVYTKAFISDSESEIILSLLDEIKKKLPKVHLNLIGKTPGNLEKMCKSKGLANNIKLYGLVDYKKNLEIVAQSYIGIAWYENVKSFEKYADSLKIREYAASGIPSVSNKNITTALEAYEKGLLFLCVDTVEMARNIHEAITNQKLYNRMRENALKWAQENDKGKLLKGLYSLLKII